MQASGLWLIPFKGRNRSGPVDVNGLWRSDALYVMDNHRLALWCWWQHLSEAPYWNFLHIDRHYDGIWWSLDWNTRVRAEHKANVDAFIDARQTSDGHEHHLYQWDSLISSFWSLHHAQLNRVVLATGKEGEEPKGCRYEDCSPWALMGELETVVSEDPTDLKPWIVDIDLDYFTVSPWESGPYQLLSDATIRRISHYVRRGLEMKRIGVVTVALSPETTGDWDIATALLRELFTDWSIETPDFGATSGSA